MDLISVGITCFNAENSVEDAVRSALLQTWPLLEVVVVDDHSTDGSWQILEKLAGEDSRMKIIRHKTNQGVGRARNTILDVVQGVFVAFFDDDDVSDPERLSGQHRRIVQYERDTGTNTVVCYTATKRIYPGGKCDYSPCLGMDLTPAPYGRDVARLILLGKPAAGSTGTCPASSQMARREVFQLVDGFDENLRRHEDTDFNLRVALKGAHFAGMAQPLVTQTMTFTSDKSVDEERHYARKMIEKHRTLLEDWRWYQFCLLWWNLKFTRLEKGQARALPFLLRLVFTSPVKTAKKIIWTLPNRRDYRRYKFSTESGG